VKKLLATTAVAMIALTGAASAQSVLERVLSQIDNATNLASVNGTFANIAENIGGSTSVRIFEAVAAGGETITEAEYLAEMDRRATAAANAVSVPAAPVRSAYPDTTAGNAAYTTDLGLYTTAVANRETAFNTAVTAYEALYTDAGLIEVGGLAGVNGSINNTVDGITTATETAIAGVVTAVEFNMPTMNFGTMATTALGAVNTGEITLGVNASVDEAKTSSTNAVSTVMGQLGGSADTGAIVLNVASNMTGINGSINNSMTEVNGVVGALSTTALGAVNTGTIISGVNSAVQGIIGTSGANVATN
jgi:hypothetical protein